MLLGQMRVPGRHRRRLVPEQFHHRSLILAAHREIRGEVVPEVVEAEVSDTSLLAGPPEGHCHLVWWHRPAVFLSKQEGRVDASGEAVNRLTDGFIHRDHLALVVLGLLDDDQPVLPVDVAPLEVEDFSPPQSGVHVDQHNGT